MMVLDMAYTFSFRFLTKVNTSATLNEVILCFEVDFIRFLTY